MHTVFQLAGYHGTGGFMTISDVRLTPLSDILYQGYAELGLPGVDINGPDQIGMYFCHSSIHNLFH